ncbi:hypothetical protein PYS65_00025 [Streptomyces cathayae]|uniref:Uncharacterized protein n=1 Tax=Streptomyces cathayae TaxID=3031124 RepID=A0ABY8KBW3_9ACTN|nr:hypothetical protein [Streptomyces sp. HUAS 5]WGD45114.1 hypothetical protein PYS65_00025 [Streptomyces sp. HUAS 5]
MLFDDRAGGFFDLGVEVLVLDLPQYIFFALEVVVERTLGEVGAVDDLLERGSVESFLFEQVK